MPLEDNERALRISLAFAPKFQARIERISNVDNLVFRRGVLCFRGVDTFSLIEGHLDSEIILDSSFYSLFFFLSVNSA